MAIIEVDGLTKRYGEHTTVNGVTFSVDRGEIFGIMGPNGAGKTTTVECIAGLRRRDAGTVRVGGVDPERDGAALRKLLGAQLQESELPDRIRVGEAMRLYSSFYGNPVDWRELLRALGLAEKTKTQFRRLSGGQKQRLSVALALVGDPRVVVLDELTTGLDPQARRGVWELVERIRDRGVTVLLVTHFMEEAERLCDRLTVIDRGRVVATDTPAALIESAGAMQTIRFRPSAPLDPGALEALQEVTAIERAGEQFVVIGSGNVIAPVTALLSSLGVEARELRVEGTTLEDAYVRLTGQSAGRTGDGS